MTQAQGKKQDAQNAQQREYPANARSGYNETQPNASGDNTQVDQIGKSWHPSEDLGVEHTDGATQTTEEEPGRGQQDSKTRGSGDDPTRTQGPGRDSRVD